VPSTVLFAGTKLRRQTQGVGLLLRADANAAHRADHLRQLSANIGRRQGAPSRHDGENFFVRHRVRGFAEQLAAPRNRDRFRFFFHVIAYIHGHRFERESHDSCSLGGALAVREFAARATKLTWSRALLKSSATFRDFDEYERLVVAAKDSEPVAYLAVLLGGEAGLRAAK
jgi:hypothetical protein